MNQDSEYDPKSDWVIIVKTKLLGNQKIKLKGMTKAEFEREYYGVKCRVKKRIILEAPPSKLEIVDNLRKAVPIEDRKSGTDDEYVLWDTRGKRQI